MSEPSPVHTWISEALDNQVNLHTALTQERARVRLLEQGIREHRNQKGDDRCWEDDLKLYQLLPEGVGEADLRLQCPEVMLANCQRYIAHRHNPDLPYVSPQKKLAEVEDYMLHLKGVMDEVARIAHDWPRDNNRRRSYVPEQLPAMLEARIESSL